MDNNVPEGAMTSFDQLEANFGGEEAAPEPVGAFWVSKLEIAEKAYGAMLSTIDMVCMHENDVDLDVLEWDELDPEKQEEWADITLLALRMHTQPDEDFARLVHSKRAMIYLLQGYKFDEKHDDVIKKTHMVAPYESTPHERRAPLLIFKGVVKALFKVWDQDNPLLTRN